MRSVIAFLALALAAALFFVALVDPTYSNVIRVIAVGGLALVVAVLLGWVYPYRRP